MFSISSKLSIVIYYPHRLPWVGADRPCALRSRGFNRQVTDPIFPLCFSFYFLRLSRVGAGRPCALRSRGFNRRVMDSIFPLWFSFYDPHFPRVGAGRPCALRSRGFNRRSPLLPPNAHHLDDSFRFVFFQFDSLASKIPCVLCAFYVFHFINTFFRVLLRPPSFLGRRRPTLCPSQPRF
jgi:hypothetical protein